MGKSRSARSNQNGRSDFVLTRRSVFPPPTIAAVAGARGVQSSVSLSIALWLVVEETLSRTRYLFCWKKTKLQDKTLSIFSFRWPLDRYFFLVFVCVCRQRRHQWEKRVDVDIAWSTLLHLIREKLSLSLLLVCLHVCVGVSNVLPVLNVSTAVLHWKHEEITW